MTLPLIISPGDPGHIAHHEEIHGLLKGTLTQGALEDRPTAGTQGRYYFADDVDRLYRDDGASWKVISEHQWDPRDFFQSGEVTSTITDVQIQRMFDAHLAARGASSMSAGAIHFPGNYTYALAATPVYGDGAVTQGLVVYGDGRLGTRMPYTGSTAADKAGMIFRNCPRIALRDFGVFGSGGGASVPVALWLSVDDGVSASQPKTDRLYLGGVAGLRIGGTQARALAGTLNASTGTANMGSHNGHNISAQYGMHCCGANVENQTLRDPLFDGSSGSSGTACIWSQNARNMKLDGGELTMGDFQTWLIKVTHSTTSDGLHTVEGPVRVEKFSGYVYVDADNAGGATGSNQPVDFDVSGVRAGSLATGGPYLLTDIRAPGTLTMRNSKGGSTSSTISIGETVTFNQNYMNKVVAIGCGFNNSTAESDPHSLVVGHMKGTAAGASTRLRAALIFCYITASDGKTFSAEMSDRVMKQTPTQILAGTYTDDVLSAA